ncbi:MAG: MBL fold metallo-hydrolase [Deinococcota bacterium]
MNYLNAGAGQTVTGSCHWLELAGTRLLIDCGMFQGRQHAHNRERFPFSPSELDAVLLTHGHLDHIGRLPMLIKAGYDGPIYATQATTEIARITLLDAARLQREDYKRSLHKARRAGREEDVPKPLFDDDDVTKTLAAMRVVAFEERLELAPNLHALYHPAGHILGSAFIELDSSDGRIIFSGDLGNRESSLQQDASLPPACDVVVIETTYANRTHRSTQATISEFREVIKTALARGGNVMIPSFALERTQVILAQLDQLSKDEDLKLQIFLDSPMAAKMTNLYRSCANEFVPSIVNELATGDDPFDPDGLTYTVSSSESHKINDIHEGAIIIAGSGMMTGGRIVHHLKHNIWRDNASLVVVGYQAEGTLGRKLVDSMHSDAPTRVFLLGDEIIVRANVHTLGGFSAHADQDDLLAWLAPAEASKTVLVHGELSVMNAFKGVLEARDQQVLMPSLGEQLNLS